MAKVTKTKALEKILDIQYDKGKIETINKIMEGAKEGDGLDKATRIIDNINKILLEVIEKYKQKKLN